LPGRRRGRFYRARLHAELLFDQARQIGELFVPRRSVPIRKLDRRRRAEHRRNAQHLEPRRDHFAPRQGVARLFHDLVVGDGGARPEHEHDLALIKQGRNCALEVFTRELYRTPLAQNPILLERG
jgi:hypothetical protein